MSKALFLVAFYDREEGARYDLITTTSYENAVKYVKYDFGGELLPNDSRSRNLELVNEDGEWLVKDPDAEPTEYFDSQLVGEYSIEHIDLYETADIDELLK